MPKELLTTHNRHVLTDQGELQPARLCKTRKPAPNPETGQTHRIELQETDLQMYLFVYIVFL